MDLDTGSSIEIKKEKEKEINENCKTLNKALET